MVAIHVDSHVFAVLPEAFSQLVDLLLHDVDHMARIGVKMAVSVLGTAGSTESTKRLPERHSLLISRLRERWSELGHLLCFSLAGNDIKTYLLDALEGYRGNHIGEFAFFLDQVEGSDDLVLTLEAYDPPTWLQRMTKAERAPRQRVVIPARDIESVVGTSVSMKLKLRNSELWLTRRGSISNRDDG